MPKTDMRRSTWLIAAAGVAALGLAACENNRETEQPAAESPPADAAPAAGAAATPASAFMPVEMDMKEKMTAAVGSTPEHTWAVKMIAHHQGGVDMSEKLLEQSPDGPMRDMAQKTKDMQAKDIEELEKWVQRHKAGGSGTSNPFAGMEQAMSQKMMAATGRDADETWARKMIEHHRGSIDMSKRVLQDAKDPEIRRMAQKTIDMQTKDIEELRSRLGA